jgi:hypothetical protein
VSIDEHLTYYRELLADLNADLDPLESRKLQIIDMAGAAKNDVTQSVIRNLKLRIAKVQSLIMTLEERKVAWSSAAARIR